MHITHFDVVSLLIFLGYCVLAVLAKLPSVEAIRKLVSTLDDRGGNILVLLALTGWFFATARGLFYHAIGLISNGKIDAKDAVLMFGLTFVTGSAFGGAFAALLKTLTGNMTVAPPNASGTGVPLAVPVQLPADRRISQLPIPTPGIERRNTAWIYRAT